MADQIFALQRDVDMIATQVNHLTQALSDLDLVLKRTDDLCLEQKFQSVQMNRMDDTLRTELPAINKRLYLIEKQLEVTHDDIKRLKSRVKLMETRLNRMEKLLLLICQKLDINPNALPR